MFTNLIESSSHEKEFKRRGSFFLITVFAYSLILSAAGIVSVYAYDAQLEAQTSSLELLQWVPPAPVEQVRPIPEAVRPLIRRATPSTAPVDPSATRPERKTLLDNTNNPTNVPDHVGVTPSSVPVYTEGAVLSTRNVNPPATPNTTGTCVSCPTEKPRVDVDDKVPEPPVKPPTTKQVTSQVLTSKAISVPQPPYPRIAKDTHTFGVVSVQILVDEQGKVISAHIVSGHPFLTNAARDAAMRARFTPTILNGQPVKIQGVITYNFVLQ